MKIGIFVGSFDPFTIGHDSIVRRALPLFERIVIGVGVNERKKYMLDTEERTGRIAKLYADEPKIVVKAYGDLTTDFARREGAEYIIKGVRSVKDFEYEENHASMVHHLMPESDTIFLLTRRHKPTSEWCRDHPVLCRATTGKHQFQRCERTETLRKRRDGVPSKGILTPRLIKDYKPIRLIDKTETNDNIQC